MSKKLTIQEMQKLAEKKSGKCLSNEYINNKTKLIWECKEGHIWDATPNSVKSKGSWCPECADIKRSNSFKKSIQEIHILAKKRGIKCLSAEYIDSKTKLLWECPEGHKWKATPKSVEKSYVCPRCAVGKKTILDMQILALKKDGLCLSIKYSNIKTPLLWQCKESHFWYAQPSNIIHNTWCPLCFGRGHTIKDMQKIAKVKGGRCLSSKYIDSNTKLEWECKEKHTFWMNPNIVQQGHWCPECSDKLSERICRSYFELIFKKKFPSKRPKWLVNTKGNRMELDGYSEKLRIAFEYQGEQHFRKLFYFHDLEKIQSHDCQKEKICKDNNVKLIIIPYTLKYEDMHKYILDECKKQDIVLPDRLEYKDYKELDAYLKDRLEKYQKIAKDKGGKCLSKNYIRWDKKLKFQCGNCEYIWRTLPAHAQKYWCPRCAAKQRGYTLRLRGYNKLNKVIKQKKGKILSDYKDSKTKIHLECEHEHKWWALPNSIMRGRWCPICGWEKSANKRKIIGFNNFKKIVDRKKGKILSEYVDNKTKIHLECHKGHKWWVLPLNIWQGNWCPECFKLNKKQGLIKYSRRYKSFPHKHKF